MRLSAIHTGDRPNQHKSFEINLCDENQFVREKTVFR